MQILVNGEPHATEAGDLAALCAELELADAKIATARNGDFVPTAARADTRLTDGDEIEIVAPRQGG
ncbi:sulfur carrier protein ThiS [Methyloligella halotolerans]|uniref:Sulfur carrier protein ThiS n=1 Tax=Methyloligella halotolerans TaxID=1177755 RepID=A0A1E2RYZ6_9HYPH|nr:sulfur carrier protein ThiS [Methyloligella halotolerans]ODA67457.1 sulfur carrier protein ThiS [Methyloligella halotolerans]